MSEIQSFYPTSGMSDRTYYSIMTAFYDCFKSIPAVTDFFDSVEKLGDETKTDYSDFGVKFIKGNAYFQLGFNNSYSSLRLYNNSKSNYSDVTQETKTVDIAVHHTVGTNNTNVIWFDGLNKGICMVFSKYGDKYFLANSSGGSSYSFYYSDTGGSVENLSAPFNGGNIGKAAEYIAQPYYHYGINTGDIYTFDGGGSYIPWGKFKLGNMEFVRLVSNFALRIS